MRKKLLLIIPLFFPLLAGCSNTKNTSEYDPFMIGDNLEVISMTEAKLIANEAYDNLVKTSSLIKSSTMINDTTKFFTGAFSTYATNVKTKTDEEANYFTNKIESSRSISTTTFIGNDSTIKDQNTSIEEWYSKKPIKEGEEPSDDYFLLRKTVEKFGGVSSTRFFPSSFPEESKFSTLENIGPEWNKYRVESINEDYLTIGIGYSDEYTYVRDNNHILGYRLNNVTSTESSKIAPGKDDVSYVKKESEISVIDFYKDEVLGIGWTVKTVSSRFVTSYLTTIDGNETEPIEVKKEEEVTSLFYENNHSESGNIPEFVLQDDSHPFFISKFVYNEEHTGIEYANIKFNFENNDDYYRRFEDSFDGHAYYKEQKLEVGYYSFFDGTPEDIKGYEKWGYSDFIANKCVNNIIDPKTLPETEQVIIAGHNKLFYVAVEATYAFRVVFDAEMTTASEFSVAVIGR